MAPPNSGTGRKRCKTTSTIRLSIRTCCTSSQKSGCVKSTRWGVLNEASAVSLCCSSTCSSAESVPLAGKRHGVSETLQVLTAIKTSCLHSNKRLIPVAAMESTIRFMISNRKSDNDFVAPMPIYRNSLANRRSGPVRGRL